MGKYWSFGEKCSKPRIRAERQIPNFNQSINNSSRAKGPANQQLHPEKPPVQKLSCTHLYRPEQQATKSPSTTASSSYRMPLQGQQTEPPALREKAEPGAVAALAFAVALLAFSVWFPMLMSPRLCALATSSSNVLWVMWQNLSCFAVLLLQPLLAVTAVSWVFSLSQVSTVSHPGKPNSLFPRPAHQQRCSGVTGIVQRGVQCWGCPSQPLWIIV